MQPRTSRRCKYCNRLDVDYEIRVEPGEITAKAFHDGRPIGHVTLHAASPEGLTDDCKMDYDFARRSLPEGKLYVVYFSRVNEDYRGEGIGTELYIRAVKATTPDNGVVVPGACHEDFRSTSHSAQRVWESSTFQSEIKTLNYLAWYGL